jgi:dTDP-4-amino-4,6-dideoxygalactose transaminase
MGPFCREDRVVIQLARPDITDDDIAAVADVLRSRHLVQGRQVEELEAELASLVGVEHMVVVSSGTAALHAAMHVLDIGPGDLVIVPGYSWVATANVVEMVGATPVFVDISESDYCIDPSALTTRIDELSASGDLGRLRAIVPVHAFGYVAEMSEVSAVAADLGVPVVEDAACALGAAFNGRMAGSLGDIGCFSFHPRKVITTGEGGAVATNDGEVAEAVRRFRNHGQDFGENGRRFSEVGINYRITDVMAALGRSQLRRLETLLTRRRALAERYLEALADLPVGLPAYRPERTAVQAFVVRLDRSVETGSFIAGMARRGVETGLGTIAIPFTDVYLARYGLTAEDLPITHAAGTHAVALPLHTGMEDGAIDEVVGAMRDVLGDGSP